MTNITIGKTIEINRRAAGLTYLETREMTGIDVGEQIDIEWGRVEPTDVELDAYRKAGLLPENETAITLKLKELYADSPDALRLHVIQYAMDLGPDVKECLEDILQHGCVSGCVGHLIYTHDTHKFFDEFYEEIMELAEAAEEDSGEPLYSFDKGDLKNWFAWFGFETIVSEIYAELEGLE